MSKIKKYLIWYYMLSKRLLLKKSFILLLCLIPVIVPLSKNALSEEDDIFEIVLCCEDGNASVKEIIQTLINDEGIISFSECTSAEQAREAVAGRECDAAWIFLPDFDERLKEHISRENMEPLVEIVECEETFSLKASKEILYKAMYNKISYSIYENFIYTEVVHSSEVSEDTVRRYYEEITQYNAIIKPVYLSTDGTEIEKNVNYLTSPIRGLLSLIVVLCTLASAMYFLKDQSEGKFDWMSMKARIIPAFASCLSGALFSAIAVFVAFQISGISGSFFSEFFLMLLYVVSTTGFCLMLCMIFRSPGKLGATIPGIMITMLVLSPIFFNVKVLRPIRLMLPSYYYLHSLYDVRYCLYTLIYCAVVYTAVWFLNRVFENRKPKHSLF